MNINDFSKEVHENAKAHGWWDEDRSTSFGTIVALISSEWSEALEEYRANRPPVWYGCLEAPKDGDAHVCCPKDESECANFGKEFDCKYHSPKPEGVAVELIDGCIRILDWFGHEKLQIGVRPAPCAFGWVAGFLPAEPQGGCPRSSVCASLSPPGPNTVDKLVRQAGTIHDKMDFPDIVAWLNLYVSRAFFEYGRNMTNGNKAAAQKQACGHLLEAMSVALRYVSNTGNDPEEIMQLKHEYNKNRAYKHGNKVC